MKHLRPLTFSLALLASSAFAAQTPAPTTPPYGLPKLDRDDFNRLAGETGVPLFWRSDVESPGELAALEIVVLGNDPKNQGRFIKAGAFTADFEKAYRALVELRRREAVRAELAQGRPTLVELDATKLPPEEQTILKGFQKIAELIDQLYDFQVGAAGLEKLIPKDDAASLALFQRNHGAWCEAPKTQGDAFCNATSTFAEKKTQSYPLDVVTDKAFCDALQKEANAKDLTAPFTVVRKAKAGGYEAVPYGKVYGKWTKAIAKELLTTAKAIGSGEEIRLKNYLEAAAKAFETNDWVPADEAWSAMAGSKSKWYVRIGPDETYWDPCGLKAGYHLSFARIDPSAEKLKEQLTAIRTDLEKALETLVGAEVYKARDVKFNLPDFIEIVLNAGDSRDGLGATIGQSLPNFGKVAEESRGRTVVMANLYTDVDSLADGKAKDELLLSKKSLEGRDDKGDAGRMTTVLHEATHNLGPTGSFQVGGKKPEELFGGDLDAILEELKAETGALYYLPLLKAKGVLTDEQVKQAYLAAISWNFGHISRGLFTPDKRPKTYSHVAAIQTHALIKAGALTWDPADGQGTPDAGRLAIDYTKVPAAMEALMKEVVTIKAKGDKAAAEKLDQTATSEEAVKAMHADAITERILRFAKASFVYAVRWQ